VLFKLAKEDVLGALSQPGNIQSLHSRKSCYWL